MGIKCGTALAAVLAAAGFGSRPAADDMLVLRGKAAQASVALGGGGLTELRFVDASINPLNWEISEQLEPRPKDQPYLRGHFLCLDRWGAPSEAEARRGVPFHGEAPRVVWQLLDGPSTDAKQITAAMSCTLPLAGMQVRRQLRLAEHTALLSVTEEVTNTNKLGRIYNMVQHPTIAPPFLDDSTLVDTSARQGFDQQGALPPSRASASLWPHLNVAGRRVDLRHFRNTDDQATAHDVTSFVFDDADRYGWVTAVNPAKRLVIGYLWRTADYPWLNIWRYRYQGRVTARGLEFGTTGYHQPYAVLVRTGKILDRPLYEYVDAGQTVRKSYVVFLFEVPDDFRGVARVGHEQGVLSLIERAEHNPRTLTMNVGTLFPPPEP